jgi:hypothetical protein
VNRTTTDNNDQYLIDAKPVSAALPRKVSPDTDASRYDTDDYHPYVYLALILTILAF